MVMLCKFKLMNVFLNGYSYQGVVKFVMLLKLICKFENYCGVGMNGSVLVDFGFDDDVLLMEWLFGGFLDLVIWEFYVVIGVDVVLICFVGFYQCDDIGVMVKWLYIKDLKL